MAVGQGWSNDDKGNEDCELEHRAKTATRSVPVAPPLADLLDPHIKDYEPGARGQRPTLRHPARPRWAVRPHRWTARAEQRAYTTAWRQAREAALTPGQQRSLLGKPHYDLRHACLSTWLNAGVPTTQVAEWAGNSVKVLLAVYAKCIRRGTSAALRRIHDADRKRDELTMLRVLGGYSANYGPATTLWSWTTSQRSSSGWTTHGGAGQRDEHLAYDRRQRRL